MPAIQPPAKVLVTGANGFIAAWVVRALLDRGYSVRGTVRTDSKSMYLRDLLKAHVASGDLEFVLVPDIAAPGAFDEAVKDVDAIVHAASPVHLNADDPKEVIRPAVKGTIGLLESALKHGGPQLKRIAYMSSSGAVLDTPYIGTFDETSWNEGSISEVLQKGRKAGQMMKYRASKTLAEKAAWEFIRRRRSLFSWDFVTTCPTYVFGPVLSDARTVSELGASMLMFYEGVFSKATPLEYRASYQSEWVDVRDMAEAQVRALEVPEAGGKRFIVSREVYNWLDWCDTVNDLNVPGVESPHGTYSVSNGPMYKLRFDATASRTVLGMKCRYSMPQTAKDIVEDFKARGIVG